jgi:hypothetical protein
MNINLTAHPALKPLMHSQMHPDSLHEPSSSRVYIYIYKSLEDA